MNNYTIHVVLKFVTRNICHVNYLLSLCLPAVRRIREVKQRAIRLLKSDHFLADANWELVDKNTNIEDPYKTKADVQVRT